MFSFFKKNPKFSVDRAISICHVVLANDQYDEFRNNKLVYEDFVNDLGSDLLATGEQNGTDEQVRYLRCRLMESARMNALAYIFLMSGAEERQALVREIWESDDVSDEEAEANVNAMGYQQQVRYSCLQLVLNDLTKPNGDSWWSDYMMLCMGDIDHDVMASAGDSILAGENLAGFEEAIDQARSNVQAKRDANQRK